MSIDPTAVIHKSAVLGACTIGRHVVIHPNVTIGDGAIIEDFSIIGYGQLTHTRHVVEEKTSIGAECRIRTHSVIYRGCTIGERTSIGHHVGLREETVVGHDSSIGSSCWCEGYTFIGNFTTIHAQCHLTARMFIGDYVFIGPQITTANARSITHRRHGLLEARIEQGPTIHFGARIGSQVMLLPGVTIGREALVAAGSNVTKDVPSLMMVRGNPARIISEIHPSEQLRPGIDYTIDTPEERIRNE